jgi:3-deoxy-D-manno-octulosonate 8-phosphate phosphatase (KDO 8-P phosphatase)
MPIDLIVLDVDGCLTDGRIIYTENGDEIKAFDVKDGLAIAGWIGLGKEAAIITGRRSAIVSRRAEELGIRHCYQGVRDKGARLSKILDELGIGPDRVAVIGDDLNDYVMLRDAAVSFAPSDAVPAIREIADVLLRAGGGRGAVREMIEILMEREGLQREFFGSWSVE